MPDYQKMYSILFNAISDGLEELDNLNIGSAKKIFKEAQARTEELYMSQDEETPAQEEKPAGEEKPIEE